MEMKAERLAAHLAAISVMHLVDACTHARKAAIAASGSRLRPASRYKQRVFVISRARLHGGRSRLGGLFFVVVVALCFLRWMGGQRLEGNEGRRGNKYRKQTRTPGEGRKNYVSDRRTGKLRIMTKSSCE